MGGLDRKEPWNPDWLLKDNCYRFKNSNTVGSVCFVTLTIISTQTLHCSDMLPIEKWEHLVILETNIHS